MSIFYTQYRYLFTSSTVQLVRRISVEKHTSENNSYDVRAGPAEIWNTNNTVQEAPG